MEKFVSSSITFLFSSVVGIGFLIWFSITKNGWLTPVFVIGILVLGSLTGLLSKKIKTVQRSINSETTEEEITNTIRQLSARQ